MKIKTNNQPRLLLPLTEVPFEYQADFDYIGSDIHSYRMVQYKGVWYDTDDTVANVGLPANSALKKWDSHISDSFFSGVVFKFVGDEEVIVGTYYV